jgi:L-fuconolactonase
MTRVIDAHHHLWGAPTAAGYPWMTDAFDPIRRPFGVDDLQVALAPTGVDGTVVVQARTDLDEARGLLALAAGSSTVAGVVGWADLLDPGLAEVLSELQAGPGGDRLVGIRHPVHDEPDAEWLLRPEVRRGISTVGRAGLAFDLLVRPREMPAALEVARGEPGMRFVVNHLAKPPIASGELEPWATSLRDLAAEPNTWCKVSGLVTEADRAAWTVDRLRPYVDHALDIFGPDRLLFGSDWPVCLVAASYETVFETAATLTGTLSPAERAEVFGGTAQRAYRFRS